MRIALVTQHSPLNQSLDAAAAGHPARIAGMASSLAQLGHRVTVYARKDCKAMPGQAILAPGVTVEHVPAGPPSPVPDDDLARHAADFAGYLSRRWQARPPDLVHGYSWISGLAALAGARGLDIPVAQTFDSPGYLRGPGRTWPAVPPARLRLEASIARTASAVFASSSDEAAELVRLGVARSAITVVPCGVDTARFTPAGKLTPAKRTQPAARRHRLLAVAPLNAQSGLDTVIRALADVSGAELTIAGGPPRAQLRRDPGYLQLTGLARDLGVRHRVTFAGQASQPELVDLLREADILVSASVYEPSGMMAVQAMACGTPVVVSAVGSHRDAVVDGTTGLLVPPGQPQLLATRLRRLLASPALLEAYGIAAADRARSRYSWDRIGRETLAAYERILPVRRIPAAAARSAARRPVAPRPAAEPSGLRAPSLAPA